jgi:peptide/nickel transport system ATP-binding protein
MNPPSGCPFQTRCHRKIGAICEDEMPAVKELAPGHRILCHLDEATLRAMEPVIAFGEKGGGGARFAAVKAARKAGKMPKAAKPVAKTAARRKAPAKTAAGPKRRRSKT